VNWGKGKGSGKDKISPVLLLYQGKKGGTPPLGKKITLGWFRTDDCMRLVKLYKEVKIRVGDIEEIKGTSTGTVPGTVPVQGTKVPDSGTKVPVQGTKVPVQGTGSEPVQGSVGQNIDPSGSGTVPLDERVARLEGEVKMLGDLIKQYLEKANPRDKEAGEGKETKEKKEKEEEKKEEEKEERVTVAMTESQLREHMKLLEGVDFTRIGQRIMTNPYIALTYALLRAHGYNETIEQFVTDCVLYFMESRGLRLAVYKVG